MVHIVGLTGSLRKASTNTGLLRALKKILPAPHTMEIVVPDIPLYNGDVEAAGLPQAVKDFRGKLKRADAFIFACPEYNYSMAGPLKNALDWGSRGDNDGNIFNDKPGGCVSAGGQTGGVKSTLHMLDSAVFLNLHMMNHPQFPIRIFVEPSPFDKNGDLVDPDSLNNMKKFLDAFLLWNARIGQK